MLIVKMGFLKVAVQELSQQYNEILSGKCGHILQTHGNTEHRKC